MLFKEKLRENVYSIKFYSKNLFFGKAKMPPDKKKGFFHRAKFSKNI